MANSIYEATGDGSTTDFTIPYTYLEANDVTAFVGGVSTSFTFTSDNIISFVTAPANGANVRVVRNTDVTGLNVTYSDGGALTAEQLNTSNKQLLFGVQEAIDTANEAMILDSDGKFQGQISSSNRVIKNVANPVNAQDVVTKNYLENTWLNPSDKTQLNSLNTTHLSTVATNVADVTTVANNISDVNAFAQVYRSGATDPTTSLDVGDLFYNTTSNLLKIWNGSSWETGVAGASGLLPLAGGTMTGNIAFSGSQTVDGRDVSTDGAKLDLIEAAADVTDAANVNPLVDAHLNTSTAASNQVLGWTGTDYDWVDNDSGSGDLLAANNLSDLTNTTTARTNLGVAIGSDVQAHSSVLDGTTASFTTAEESKLAGIEDSATADQTGAEIKAAYEAEANTNAFTDAEKTKLTGIEAGATADQTNAEIRAAVEAATDSNVFTDADHTKLNGIEAGANVTDTTNVTAAGALMDSEVTNLAQVKAFDSSDYATAAQGTLATNALPKSGGAMTGAITTNSTVDGRDVSVDGAKLDGIEAGATADQTASEIRALVESATDSNVFTDADHTKLNNVSTTELYGENPVSATTPTTTGNNDLAIGSGAEAIAGISGSGDAIAIGTDASAEKAAVAIGKNTDAGQYGVAIGSDDLGVGAVADSYNIAIGGGDGAASATGGTGQIAIGESAASTNNFFGTAIGQDSLALGNSALALNRSRAHSTGEFNTAINIGNNTATYGASGGSSFAAGFQAKALSLRSTALGHQADATGENAIAIGSGSTTTGAADGLAIGTGATAAEYSTAIGRGSIAYRGGVAVGAHDTTVNTFAAQASLGATAVGNSAKALGLFSNAFGFEATTALSSGTSLGESYSSGNNSLAAVIGNNTSTYGAQGSFAIAIGYLSKATATSSISIGNRVVNSTANSIAIGGDGSVSGNVETVKISGAYNLPTTDGTSGQVMTTDGSGNVSFTTVSGGGGGDPDLYRDNAVGATTPVPTGDNAVSIGSGSSTNGNQAYALGTTAAASATAAYAIGYQAQAVAGATFSMALGTNARTGAQNATAFTSSNASGLNSIAGAIGSNSTSYGATNTHAIAFGYTAKASGSHAISIGYQATAAGNYATCIGRGGSTTAEGASSLGGRSGLATGIYSTTVGGQSNKAYADYAVAMGYWTYADKIGQNAFASGRFNDDGDAQTSKFVLRSDTTDATPEALTTNNSTASTNNQIILGNNSAYSFSGTIIARQDATDGSNYASWEIKGALLRDANAASTVLGNGIQNKLYATAGASAWAIALTADTTNGGLKIEVTGSAATNIKWVAAVNTSEVIYN